MPQQLLQPVNCAFTMNKESDVFNAEVKSHLCQQSLVLMNAYENFLGGLVTLRCSLRY